MALTTDDDRTVRSHKCTECGRDYVVVTGFVFDDGDAHAIYFAALHNHGAPEAWIDVILGTFGTDDAPDHVTFGCRVGPIEGHPEPAATLVQAAVPYSAGSVWGTKLDAETARVHRRLGDFWHVVDHVLLNDPDVAHHVYH